jgi:hypothetical protein
VGGVEPSRRPSGTNQLYEHVEHLRLVVDHDQLRGILGDVPAHRDHQRHGFADEPHLPVGQRRKRRPGRALPVHVDPCASHAVHAPADDGLDRSNAFQAAQLGLQATLTTVRRDEVPIRACSESFQARCHQVVGLLGVRTQTSKNASRS